MRIPMLQNYAAQPGGVVNPAMQSNDQTQILGAQAKYAPQQAYANALLPMMQARYMPYQIQAQMMSNPMLWMASQNNPGMMQGMMKNMMGAIPNANSIMQGMGGAPQSGGGGLLGMIGNFLHGTPSNSNSNSGASFSNPSPGQANYSVLPDSMNPYIQQYGLTNVKPLGNGTYGAIKDGQPVTFNYNG